MTTSTVLDLIGKTPLVDLSELSPNPHVRIFGKLENRNPFGSVKDRVAKALIEGARQDGTLTAGKEILEASSGNTGIALAGIGRLYGHRVTIVTPENITAERKGMLEAMGATVIETSAKLGSNGAIAHVAEMLAQDHESRYVNLGQYSNERNPAVHYQTTGPEIWEACPETTHFISGLGTSGTLMGVGHYLKGQNKEIQIVAVEPPTGENLEGLRNLEGGFIPPIFENWEGERILDRKRIVWAGDAAYWAHQLNERCGILGGPSSGASIAGAVRIAEQVESGTIVLLVCDSGERYLSTNIYSGVGSVGIEELIYF